MTGGALAANDMAMTLRRLLLLIAIGLVFGAGLLWRQWSAEAPADAPAMTVVIPRGATLGRAADVLASAGVIDDATRFTRAARLLGPDKPIRAGEFRMPQGAGYGQVLEILQSGAAVQHALTVPEGLPSVLVAERLAAEPLLSGPVRLPAEGSVLPDTYAFERGESREAVLVRMEAAMERTLAELWPGRTARSVVKTPEEAVILASIVEKETGKASERRIIAGVYSNRLRRGMKLDADPTVIYPLTKGKPLGRRIRRSELDAVNGYNTYAMAGLPIGPIANPGRAAIAAVLDPAETDALFFVADGSGGHVFAATLAEHNRNVEKWYAIRRARGEM